MNILQLVCSYPPYKGGMGNVAFNFGQELSSRGHNLTVYTAFQNNKKNEIKPKELKYIKPIIRFGHAAFMPDIFFKLKNFDIVYLHFPYFGVDELIWLKKLLQPKLFKLVIQYHMDVPNLGIRQKILSLPHSLISKSLLKQADAIITASFDYLENSMISEFYRKNKNKFVEIPFGVDSETFFPAESIKKEFIFVGGLDKPHYFKGLKNLLHAFKLISKQGDVLKIVGEGSLRLEYENFAKNIKPLGTVEFAGSLDNKDLSLALRQALALVLPSTAVNEAYGLVLLEAMASGTAVIASDLPGVRRVFRNGVDGFLVKPNDINDLAAAMSALKENPRRAMEMGLAGRELVLQRNSWRKNAIHLEKIFKNLL